MDSTTVVVVAGVFMLVGITAFIIAGILWHQAQMILSFGVARDRMRQAFIDAGPGLGEMQDVYVANISCWLWDEHKAGRFDFDDPDSMESCHHMARVILDRMFDLND